MSRGFSQLRDLEVGKFAIIYSLYLYNLVRLYRYNLFMFLLFICSFTLIQYLYVNFIAEKCDTVAGCFEDSAMKVQYVPLYSQLVSDTGQTTQSNSPGRACYQVTVLLSYSFSMWQLP